MNYDKLTNARAAYHINQNYADAICRLAMASKPCKRFHKGRLATETIEQYISIYSDMDTFLDEFAQRAISEAEKGDTHSAMSVFNYFADVDEAEKLTIEKQRETLRKALSQSWHHREYETGMIKHWRWQQLIRATAIDVQLFIQSAMNSGATLRSEVGNFTFILQDIEKAKLVREIQAPAPIPCTVKNEPAPQVTSNKQSSGDKLKSKSYNGTISNCYNVLSELELCEGDIITKKDFETKLDKCYDAGQSPNTTALRACRQ